MGFLIEKKLFDAVALIKPTIYSDERGYFMEVFRSDILADLCNISEPFVQENFSKSHHGVLRGLHFQWEKPMGKLLRLLNGSIQLVEVDIRKDSPTLGKSCSIMLHSDDHRLVWIPPGFANGFVVLSEFAEVQYLCTAVWNPACESAIHWNDSQLNIPWEISNPIVSEKDAKARSLDEWLALPESEKFRLKM